jgi:Family of unknown function (DUF6496)
VKSWAERSPAASHWESSDTLFGRYPILKSPGIPDGCTQHIIGESQMARKYSKGSQKKVEKVMRERKAGTLRSGRSGKKVTSRKQAIAIGLSEARRAGKKVPKKKAA